MDIIRSKIEYKAGYQVVEIDGLNVLHHNAEGYEDLAAIVNQPYREFIGELLSTLCGSALFGFLMTVDVLHSHIVENRVEDLFEPVLISVLQREFFPARPTTQVVTGEGAVVEQSYFCKDIKQLLTDDRLSQHNAWSFVFDGLLYDSIALFLSKQPADIAVMRELLDSRASSDEFISRVLSLYDYILVSSYDGYYISVITKVKADIEVIQQACSRAANYIASLPWFVANRDDLKWDFNTGCLRLYPSEVCNVKSAILNTVGAEGLGLPQPSTSGPGVQGVQSEVTKSNILRVETTEDRSLKVTRVYGLNISRHNQKQGSYGDDLAFEPYRLFLSVLLAELHGSALFFGDVARNWTWQFISERHLDHLVLPVPLQVWKGHFWYRHNYAKANESTQQVPTWPFLTNISDTMFPGSAVSSSDVSLLICKNLADSGVALFLSQRSVALPASEELFAAINRNLQHHQFVESALAVYDYVIVLEADGRIVSAITKFDTDVGVIQRAADRAADFIASTSWFNESFSSLRWVEMVSCWVMK